MRLSDVPVHGARPRRSKIRCRIAPVGPVLSRSPLSLCNLHDPDPSRGTRSSRTDHRLAMSMWIVPGTGAGTVITTGARLCRRVRKARQLPPPRYIRCRHHHPRTNGSSSQSRLFHIRYPTCGAMVLIAHDNVMVTQFQGHAVLFLYSPASYTRRSKRQSSQWFVG